MHQLFSNRRLLFLAIILIVSNVVITGISLIVIYNKSIAIHENSLIDIVERQKSLVTTLHEQGKNDQEIIQFIKTMREKHYGIGRLGGFAIARRVGDSAIFLLSVREQSAYFINNAENHGLPMRMAFQGKTGFIKAKDYTGMPVLAAYTYVPSLKWGIVAKIPTSEVNQPYYNAFFIATLIFVVLLSISILLFVRISNPIIKSIIDSEEKFRRAIQNAPFPIMIHAENGEVLNISQGWKDTTGYALYDIPTIEKWTEQAYGKSRQDVKKYIDTLYTLKGSRNEGEYTINCKNGTQRIWDFSSAPLGRLNDGRRAVISIAKDITESRLAEEALKESEYFFKESQKAAFIGSYKTDFIKGYWVSSEVLDRIFGIDKEYNRSIQGWLNIVHPDDKEMIDQYLREEVILKRQPFNKEYRIVRISDGEPRWIYGLGIVEFDNQGNIISMIGTIQDITQRKHAELLIQEKNNEIEAQNEEYKQINDELLKAKENAEESEKRLLSIIENSEAGYFFIDNDGLFQNVNRAWLNLYKYEDFEEVIGKHFVNVQQLDDLESAKQFVEGIRNGDPAFTNGYFSRLCKDKTIGYHSFSARPVYLNNKIAGIEGFIIDTTKQKEVEIELTFAKEIAERNAKKFRSLFTSMQEGVYLHEIIYDNQCKAINYRIIEANPISEKYLNIKRENAIGKLATELFGTTEAPFLEIYAQVAETGEPVSFEQYFEPMDKHFLISVFSPKKGEFATAFLDITNNKSYEKELLTAKEKAEESDRLKTAFLQNMSHEIRTPMNAIIGFANLLPDNFNNKDKLKYFSTIINQRCIDLLEIINEILDISKIESGQLSVHFEECDLKSLFEELYDFFIAHRQKIDKQEIQFYVNSVCDTSQAVITDSVKLKQIFINLINNAFKFTNHGKIEAGCKFNANQQLIFYVSDTGVGIPSEKQSIIFDRFTQLGEPGAVNKGGTGLGLAIVKGLITILGGEIWLESQPGVGSTFYFSIPYKAISKTPKTTSVTRPITQHSKIFSKTLLIVEDDPYNAEYIKEILRNTGFNILHSELGKEAVDISINQPVDIILMDIRLPDMEGCEATRLIKGKKPGIKIIAQTAYASVNDKEKCLNAGCDDYISKPINSELLLEKIYEHLFKLQ